MQGSLATDGLSTYCYWPDVHATTLQPPVPQLADLATMDFLVAAVIQWLITSPWCCHLCGS